MWPFSWCFRHRSYQKQPCSWDEVRSGHFDLSAFSSGGFPQIDRGYPPACSALPMSVGHVPSSCCWCPQMNRSATDFMRKRSHCCFQLSEPQPPQIHTFPLFLTAPEKPLNLPHRDFFTEDLDFQSGIGCLRLVGVHGIDVDCTSEVIKWKVWCQMKDSLWTVVPQKVWYTVFACLNKNKCLSTFRSNGYFGFGLHVYLKNITVFFLNLSSELCSASLLCFDLPS